MFEQQSKTAYIKSRGRNLLLRYLIKLLDKYTRRMIPSGLRILFYKLMGINIGRNVFIGIDCLLDSSFPEMITIEDDVVISFRVMVICHDDARTLTNADGSDVKKSVAPVLLKKGCYIGAGAIILPGVEIGEKAVVGAGAVVTKDVAPNSIVRGIPASERKL